jgi:hypothetical protein
LFVRGAVCFCLIGGGLWWGSFFFAPHSGVYDMPVSEARNLIEVAGLPPLVFGSEEPEGIVETDGNRVTWIVGRNGAEALRYVIELTPVDAARTRVNVALKGPTTGKFGNVQQRLDKDATLRNLYLSAMNEQVDSVLRDHPFRYSAISAATAAATLAHMGQISASMDAPRKRSD